MKYSFNILLFLFVLLTVSSVSAWNLVIDDYESTPSFGGADYEGWEIEEIDIDPMIKVYNCNFKNAEIQKVYLHWAENCDFTDTWFGSGEIGLPSKDIKKTLNFKRKDFRLSVRGNLSNLDLSNFDFYNGTFQFLKVENSQMKDATFRNCTVPYMTNEQWKQTRNYINGDFTTLKFPDDFIWKDIDLSRTVWGGIGRTYGLPEFRKNRYDYHVCFSCTSLITDALFINCDLSKSRNLTLEQVKSTWNYKAGRMSLCKWPKHIEKALEEEEKAKAQEEKK